jgi:F-type H+-transporting ATPase subunit delta
MDLSLRGYVAAVMRSQPAEARPALAEELRALVDLVEATGPLAAALSDIAVPAPARQAVLADLFDGKVARPVLAMVQHAVATERAPELLAGWRELVETVTLHVERPEEADAVDQRPFGRTGLRQYLAGMVAAELEPIDDVASVEDIEDELFRVARTVADAPELRAVLADWSVPSDQRAAVLRSLLEGKAHPVTVRLAAGAVRLRTRDVVGVLDWLAEQMARARGWRVARVTAARPIDAEERQRLGDAMARLAGRPVEVRVTIDPALLGGAQVVIGDLLVDATTRHRLQQIEERLTGPEGAVRSLLGDQATASGSGS